MQKKNRRRNPQQSGLTILEILIVLSIIALIFGVLVVPNVMGGADKAKKQTARTVVAKFALAYEGWSSDHPGEDCPGSLEDMSDYVNTGAGKKKENAGKDPWGTPYVTTCDGLPEGVSFGVKSLGKDKKESADDIKSWED